MNISTEERTANLRLMNRIVSEIKKVVIGKDEIVIKILRLSRKVMC